MNAPTIVAISAPMGDGTIEDMLVYIARVSNPASAERGENPARLIRRLITHAHWSPFEMISATMRIETTRDISRQIIRHRSFAFQEFSGRYAVMPDAPVFRAARMQDHKNRQNSTDDATDATRAAFQAAQGKVWGTARAAYDAALAAGIAKEQARALLPEGMTPTTIYMAGSLRSWIHYTALRRAHGTQAEHAAIAVACRAELEKHFPLTMEVAP